LWLNRYKGSTATTADFQAVMERTSGQSLTTFFDEWLRQGVRPATPQLQAEPPAGPSNATQGPAASDPNAGNREAR